MQTNDFFMVFIFFMDQMIQLFLLSLFFFFMQAMKKLMKSQEQ